jgi:hypothetical protein
LERPGRQLAVKSTWHGRRWQSQTLTAWKVLEFVDATVTRGMENVVEIQTERWYGWDGNMNWVLSIHGGQLRVENIYFSGGQGIMEEVEAAERSTEIFSSL